MNTDTNNDGLVLTELNQLSDDTIITEAELARLFDKHPVSIKRAIERAELPPPTKLLGKPIWTVHSIRRHIQERLDHEAKALNSFRDSIETRRS